jgi:signal transduction histidine kinase
VQPSNRLEDHIKNLSAKLLKAEGQEFHRLAAELRSALSKHVVGAKVRLGQYPFADERRSRDES